MKESNENKMRIQNLLQLSNGSDNDKIKSLENELANREAEIKKL
jgi:hypothetical protein